VNQWWCTFQIWGAIYLSHNADIYEVKAASVISGLVFQMEFDTNVEGSQVQVMVISIISLMKKKMVYS
jgi:hypothetical protein